ncbi:MAG: hypothetical protein ABEH43_06645 [Flavobacteriales bacterium]
MTLKGKIKELPSIAKLFLATFVISLSLGYTTAFYFLTDTTGPTPKGVQTNYLGNENEQNPEGKRKFKMSKRELLTTIHDHTISISLIFLAIGSIFLLTDVRPSLKKFFLVEPFISIIVTFGGIWLMWTGVIWFKYIIMISGSLMTFSYYFMAVVVLWQLKNIE